MRLSRLRVTVRWLMVAVAVAGLTVSFVALMRRRAHYQVQAVLHRERGEACLVMVRAADRRLEQLDAGGCRGKRPPYVLMRI